MGCDAERKHINIYIVHGHRSSFSYLRLKEDFVPSCRLRLKRDATRAETRFCLSPKRTSPFKSAGASVHSTAVSRGARISLSNAGYNTFRGSVKSTAFPLHSPVSPSLPLPCVTVCHHISPGLYTYVFRLLAPECLTGNIDYQHMLCLLTGYITILYNNKTCTCV